MLIRQTLLSVLLMGLCGCSSNTALPGKPYHHLSNNRFRNPEGNHLGYPKFWDIVKFSTRHFFDQKIDVKIPSDHVIAESDALEQYQRLRMQDSITWLGHATFLIKIGGKVILTDPFLTNIAGPFGMFGPRRYVPPGISIDNLPPIDMILISHNHYDSLDLNTIVRLKNQEKMSVVTPLQMGHHFKQYDYQDVRELDWHDTTMVGQLTITAIPAIHFSARGLFDRNKELWAGYIIQGQQYKIFYACDSAYGTLYKELGVKYGPFDYAIIDIAAYEPQSIMRYSHITPEQAVQIGKDLGAKKLIAMHWGTILLSDEPPFEPPNRFRIAAKQAGYKPEDIWVMRIGETKEIHNRI